MHTSDVDDAITQVPLDKTSDEDLHGSRNLRLKSDATALHLNSLIDHPAYINLLQQYPSLKPQLQSIYEATLESQSDFKSEGRRGNWSQDRADKSALKMLQKLKSQSGESGSAITAFVTMINDLFADSSCFVIE
jgi:hypothetical protein